MPEDFSAGPERLRDAAVQSLAAAEIVDAARQALAGHGARAETAVAGHGMLGGFGPLTTAAHKVSTFTRQWAEELERIAVALGFAEESLVSAADHYHEGEATLADALRALASDADG